MNNEEIMTLKIGVTWCMTNGVRIIETKYDSFRETNCSEHSSS